MMKDTLQRLTGLKVEPRENPQSGVSVGAGKWRVVLSWRLVLSLAALVTALQMYSIYRTGRVVPIKNLWDGPAYGSTNDWRRVAEERHADLTNRLQRIEDKCRKR